MFDLSKNFNLSKMFILPNILLKSKNNCTYPIIFFMNLQFDNIMVMQSQIQYSKFVSTKNKNPKIKCQMAAILPSSLNHFGHTTESATMQFLINQ